MEGANNERQFPHSKAEACFQPVFRSQKRLWFSAKATSLVLYGLSSAFLFRCLSDALHTAGFNGNTINLWYWNTFLWKILGPFLPCQFKTFCCLFYGRAIHDIRVRNFSLSRLFQSKKGSPMAAIISIFNILYLISIKYFWFIWFKGACLKEAKLSTFCVSVLTFK